LSQTTSRILNDYLIWLTLYHVVTEGFEIRTIETDWSTIYEVRQH